MYKIIIIKEPDQVEEKKVRSYKLYISDIVN